MQVSLFNFDLPEKFISTHPAFPRDRAKFLDVATSQDWLVKDLPRFLKKGDVMVFNDTKVIPVRLFGKRGMASIEVTLHKMENSRSWWAFAKPGKKLRIQDQIIFSPSLSALVLEKKDDKGVLLEFNLSDQTLINALEKEGTMPLPPYIKRKSDGDDFSNYQTIYAKHQGAVAAPTAGLHFTDNLFKEIEEKGVQKVFVTLHVGAGTFLPVKTEDTKDHIMHSEYGIITKENADWINQAKEKGGRIIAVGTTSLRILESASDKNGKLHPFAQETDIFITPGYSFKIVDCLLTNFHLPKSTLFMLVCAFMGIDKMKKAYEHAQKNAYRFYSYGDACWLDRSLKD